MVVQVYKNLHKKGFFSIREKRTRLVIDYARCLMLGDCRFKVSKAGRDRVIKEKKKNVHAWVEGRVMMQPVSGISLVTDRMVEVIYNPFKFNSFINKETGNTVSTADWCLMVNGRVYAYPRRLS